MILVNNVFQWTLLCNETSWQVNIRPRNDQLISTSESIRDSATACLELTKTSFAATYEKALYAIGKDISLTFAEQASFHNWSLCKISSSTRLGEDTDTWTSFSSLYMQRNEDLAFLLGHMSIPSPKHLMHLYQWWILALDAPTFSWAFVTCVGTGAP